jgi:hypothetical protein
MLLGQTATGTPTNLPTDEMYAMPVAIPAGQLRVASVSALVDGQGPGVGAATIYPAVYDAGGSLIAVGDGVVIPDGDGTAWRTLPLTMPGVAIAESMSIAIRASGPDNAARLYGFAHDVDAVTLSAVADAPADLSGATPSTREGSLFADVFEAWSAPAVEDAALARLPWSLSQRVLRASGPIASSRRAAVCGWHGPSTDVEQGANAIVRSDGPLADLVGERLQVTYRLGTLRRTVAVYCGDEQAFPGAAAAEDLSLSRRAFMALAPLASDDITVEVQVLA